MEQGKVQLEAQVARPVARMSTTRQLQADIEAAEEDIACIKSELAQVWRCWETITQKWERAAADELEAAKVAHTMIGLGAIRSDLKRNMRENTENS